MDINTQRELYRRLLVEKVKEIKHTNLLIPEGSRMGSDEAEQDRRRQYTRTFGLTFFRLHEQERRPISFNPNNESLLSEVDKMKIANEVAAELELRERDFLILIDEKVIAERRNEVKRGRL